MGQFLRFAAMILLVLIGFGSGICGLFGLAMTVPHRLIRDELSASFRHRSGAAAIRSMPAVVMASQRPASGHDAAINAGSATPAGARNT
jgi:hypothetical protein